MSKVELIRQGVKMYGPAEGKPTPPDAWYALYFDHVPSLLTHIDTLTARVSALEDALQPFTEIGGWYGQPEIPLPNERELAFMLPIGWLNKARTALATTYPAKER